MCLLLLVSNWGGHSLTLRMPLFCQYYTSWFTDLWLTHASSKSVVKQSYMTMTQCSLTFFVEIDDLQIGNTKFLSTYILEVSHFVTFNVLVQRILDYHNDSVQKNVSLIKFILDNCNGKINQWYFCNECGNWIYVTSKVKLLCSSPQSTFFEDLLL